MIYTKHLRQAFGWPAALLAAGGAVLAAYRAVAGPDRVKWALLLVFPAVYFYLINGWGFMFARYALPMVPFMAVWAAIAVAWLIGLLSGLRVSVSGRRAVDGGRRRPRARAGRHGIRSCSCAPTASRRPRRWPGRG